MTNDEIDQLTGAFAYAIAALDAQAADRDASLALCNKANQCWDELLTEREALLKIVRAVANASPHSRYTAWFTPPPLPQGVTIEGMADNYIELDEAWREKARALLGKDSQP